MGSGQNQETVKRQRNNKNDQSDSYRTLQILDEIARGRPVTQRSLSRKLGVGLGIVNSYINRLVQAGYIQISQAGGKRLHYFLTPTGIAERSLLAYRYIKRSYQVFTEARERIGSFLSNLENEGVKSVVLYKATVIAEIALMTLQDTSLDLVAIVDDTGVGRKFLGYRILPVALLRQIKFDRLLITAEDPVERMVEHLTQYGVKEDSICFLQ